MIGKVLDGDGFGSSEQLARGMVWAVEGGANVISLSIGIDFPGYVRSLVKDGVPSDFATSRALDGYRASTKLFDTLIGHIHARAGRSSVVVIVAAAGSESRRELGPDYTISAGLPAVADGVICVGAVRQEPAGLKAASFSNTGVTVCAPGVDILSAVPGGGVRMMSGTSMATPHVAGVAALWAQKLRRLGRLNQFELVSRLVSSATYDGLDVDCDPRDMGAGIIQAPQN